MENKTALVFFSTLILSCFIAQSSAFLGFKNHKLMRNTIKSLFNASKIFIDETKLAYAQEGTKENDQIKSLPGQPKGITFNQYGGYVTVDQKAGRALYYYFVEAQHSAQTLPLVLWLNGGPGCSSLGYGSMQELGPFRVMSDGKTLFLNEYAWNKLAANVLFLESPAGVGFSYSKTKTDYTIGGDEKTAKDNYVFLVNWLKRFPEYRNRDFYIAGESYAGYYVPELTHLILYQKKANMLTVKLKGIIIGNAVLNDETDNIGQWTYLANHAVITDEFSNRAINGCADTSTTSKCGEVYDEYSKLAGNINMYNIYAPICLSNLTNAKPKITSIFNPDPCSEKYVHVYMNRADVQKALHANVTNNIPYDWELCSDVLEKWTDSPVTVLPLLKEFMNHGLRVWVFSGDVDGRVPVTSTQLAIKEMKLSIQTQWRPWYLNKEVGGYTQGYKGGLTFVTVRGAGHEVPTYQPERALALVQHFLKGDNLPIS